MSTIDRFVTSQKWAKTRKNSPNWTTLETNLESLYEKIIDINNLKTFRLLERFQNVA